MAKIYDNWERLVGATLRREELRLAALRTPSDLSLASSRSLSSLRFPGIPFDYYQIVRATNYFDTSNFIIRGRSGDLYDGVLEGGARVVVKKIDSWEGIDCMSELEVFSKVSHPRLVPLLGHCLDNFNAKFLIYKHMSNGDLKSSLRQGIDSKDGKGFKPLDWIIRLKIATGAAEALCYLHHECVPPLVHTYIQGSSVLLDDNFEARLGSLSTVCTQRSESKSKSWMTRILPLPKRGFNQGGAGASYATCAYDIHCFGLVLLQLVTGMPSIEAAFQILSYINTNDIELVKRIVDPSLILDKDQLMEAWAMAIIAKVCMNLPTSKLLQMRYVFRALQNPVQVVMVEDSSIWARLATSDSRFS